MRCSSANLSFFILHLLMISVRSQFRFTLPPPDPEEGPSLSVHDAQGNPVEAPRGVFHYSDTEQNIESKFKVPDFQELDPLRMAQDLMSAAAKAQTKRKTLGGFNMPMPFGGTPMNLEIASETRSELSAASDDKENSTKTTMAAGPARDAFEKAKEVCLHSNADSCDEALDTYHRLKFGSSLMSSTSSSDAATDLATMMVPGLGRKLEELTTEIPKGTTHEIRRLNARRRYVLPPRLPPRTPTSREENIRGFLHRIDSAK